MAKLVGKWRQIAEAGFTGCLPWRKFQTAQFKDRGFISLRKVCASEDPHPWCVLRRLPDPAPESLRSGKVERHLNVVRSENLLHEFALCVSC